MNSLMSATTVHPVALERLSRIESAGHPVLSVYLDLDPSRFPTPAARAAELSALLAGAGAREPDAEQAREAVATHPDLVHGARAVAIFSCAAAGVLEALALPEPVEPLVVIDTIPWLEPLAAMVTSEDWGIAVVSRRAARLFRGGAEGLVEFATIHDDVHGRHATGGWSQARLARGVEEQVAKHVRHTAELLLRAHRRRAFEHLAIVASSELLPTVDARLPRELRDRLSGTIERDLEHASVHEIESAVAPVLRRAERDRERTLIVRLRDALGTGGPAAAGLDEVLATLEEERVEMLLIAEEPSLTAGLCPSCGRLSAATAGRCRFEDAPLTPVDAVEHLIALAARHSVEVVAIGHERDALGEHGPVAALLRW
jgi:peptide subunit release factor 1 (eRF1)